MNFLITELKSLDQLGKVRYGYLKVLTIVTLIVSKVVDLIWLLEDLGYLPHSVVANKFLHVRATSVPVNIRKVRRHELVNNSDTKVTW